MSARWRCDHDKNVLLANVTVDAGAQRLVFSATLSGEGERVRWVDFSLTDFPQCAVHNGDGFAVGPFGPLGVSE